MDQQIDQQLSGKTTASFIPIVSTEVALATPCWSAFTLVGGCQGHMDSFLEFIVTLLLKDLAVHTIQNLNSVFQNLLSKKSSAVENHPGSLTRIRMLAFLTMNWIPNQEDLDPKESLITMNIKMNTGMYVWNQETFIDPG